MSEAKTYKFICIKELNVPSKRPVFAVLNKKSEGYIGSIEWYSTWRQYCFFPDENTVFSAGCLADIIDFISKIKVG